MVLTKGIEKKGIKCIDINHVTSKTYWDIFFFYLSNTKKKWMKLNVLMIRKQKKRMNKKLSLWF